MKIFVFLVACFAAASAVQYSYDYYCSHNFYVYPANSCYQFSCYFPSTWCETDYYEPLLEVYPDDTCENEDWEETDPAVIVARVEAALESARSSMLQAMEESRDEWLAKLDIIHDDYKSTFATYITQYYQYLCLNNNVDYTDVIAEKILEYNTNLDNKRQQALDNFNNVISQKMNIIVQYHTKLVQKSAECLNTRLQKVTEYKEKIIQQVYDSIVQFTKLHLNILDQKKAVYDEALSYLLGDDAWFWNYVKAYWSVEEYYARERTVVESLARAYAFQMTEHHKQLVHYYTCAYKCYMSNSCLRFFKKSYQSHCYNLGTVNFKSDYGVSKCFVKPFNYKMTYSEPSNMDTCDVNEDRNKAEAVINGLRSDLEQKLTEQKNKFSEWLSTWEQYHREYKAEFARIVNERHDWYIGYLTDYYIRCDGVLTPVRQAELDALRNELSQALEKACNEYNAELDAKLEEAQNQHDENMAQFEEKMNQFIEKVQQKYEDCASKRATAIENYRDQLIDQRDKQRYALEESLYKYKYAHIANFEAMLAHYNGEDYLNYADTYYLHDCYLYQISVKTDEVMNEFDAYYDNVIPSLVMHYTCNYSCKISAKCKISFSCGSFYSWSYKLPSVRTYSWQCNEYILYH